MRLRHLSVTNLYGSLTKEVSFNDEINLLVGINGSGKTSVLYAIDWLLRPDFPRLSTTPFERLALTLDYESSTITIEAVQKQRDLNLVLKTDGKTYPSIHVALKVDPAKIDDEQQREYLLDAYSALGPEAQEKSTWELLAGIPKPIVIALDRTISAEAEDKIYREPSNSQRPRRLPVARSPLIRVMEVTAVRYAAYRNKVIQLNDVLKGKLVMSALRDPSEAFSSDSLPQRLSSKDIDRLERRALEYLPTAIKGADVADRIRRYFEGAKRITEKSVSKDEKDLFLRVFANQYRQIQDLATAFGEFENESTSAYASLHRYLDIVNRFLADSRKQVGFNERTNQIGFRFLNTKGMPQDPLHGIEHLSSGERQILILFTFLAFISQEQRVFIVDEPELSLHPKWQSEFLDAFLTLKPPKTQLFFATHSPEIVGQHKDACVVLLP